MGINEFIGLDVGKKRTGIARASNLSLLAEPLETIDTDKLISKLQKIIDEKDIKAIVVGLPRNLDGNETSQTKWVRDLLKDAKKQISKPFYWQDEALTSIEATKSQKGDEHAKAAAIILQDFLDDPESGRQEA